MTGPRRASTPTKMSRSTMWLMLSMFVVAIVIACIAVAMIYAGFQPVPATNGDTWVDPSTSTSTSAVTYPQDVAKLRDLHRQVEKLDDAIQRAKATANADPEGDVSLDNYTDQVGECMELSDEYFSITSVDPGAATSQHLPLSLGFSTSTDCAPDDPKVVASLPTVTVSGIPPVN